ncbi:MAG TPA: NADH-quinone oxidoreductase subunit L, partial [bacterium]|nr:NADH-quinone oxidoreductase subunit L [bacterium]
MIVYAYFILFLPLLAFGIQMFFGKRLPRQGDFISVGAVLLTLALSISLFALILVLNDPEFHMEHQFDWINLGEFRVQLGVYLDNVSVIMLFVVAMISSLV